MTTLPEGDIPVLDRSETLDLVSESDSLDLYLAIRERMLASQAGSDVLPLETEATAGMELTMIAM